MAKKAKKRSNAKEVVRWLLNGDVGSSSETIVAAYYDMPIRRGISYPHDGGDLGRCIKLLNQIPMLERGLPRLAELDPHWKALYVNWESLKAAYYLEVGANKSGDKSHDKVYDMMQDIFDKRQK